MSARIDLTKYSLGGCLGSPIIQRGSRAILRPENIKDGLTSSSY